jgi:hypothetical protein
MSGIMIVQASVLSHIPESTQCFENFRFWDRTINCLKASTAKSKI